MVRYRTFVRNTVGFHWSDCDSHSFDSGDITDSPGGLRAVVVGFCSELPAGAVISICEVQVSQNTTKEIVVYYRKD